MSAISPHRPTSTPGPPGAFTFKTSNPDPIDDNGTKSNVQYWSGLVLSRQRIPHQVTKVGEPPNKPTKTVDYEAITAMPEFLNTSFDELRLAHYFYNLTQNESSAGIAQTSTSKRPWENPTPLPVPRPTPSQSTSTFTGVFPTIPPTPTPILTPTPSIPVANVPSESPFASTSNQFFPKTTNATEVAPPVQAFASLGLNSQPSTPAKPLRGGSGQPAQRDLFSFPRSPAAERIPAVNTAETEWEAARRTVAWRKALLEKAQAEYDEAVRLERQKFKVYSEARMNFDK
ncbi:hypothetical protein M407DRAFT_242411 [Tulasnella calospora MUT 4182]|uniref:Uncharacterized protein n=1 Tax=Tulasnella calospora MUT 4182 TaxID=1051891 RepID=A0A0C3M887_9AGAM|nr:hypothetical protein M407DRAFT_242411 [Tulasnella calospora MUT 4182]